MFRLFIGLIVAVLLTATPTDGNYVASVQQWREAYERDLKADDGWLTLAGLCWLKEGDNSVGTDDSNDIVLPSGSAPKRVGVFEFHSGIVLFRVTPGVAVTVNGQPSVEQPLRADTDGPPDLVQIGDFTMLVIHRGQRYAIRLKDKKNEARLHFNGLHWYPVKEEYRVTADFHVYPEPKMIPVPNILEETVQTPSPGYAEFSLHGEHVRLEPINEDGGLFFIFRDGTSGKTTYGSGRFLHAGMVVDGKVTLDFNKAYNPPCAFTPYATCPLPPASNRVSAAIEAGEMKYADH